ncbi:hypothetical protein SAMN05444156_0616 [Verrucomicrobium sp. GAS474]|uniref:hypothetical protein n=1 Tax=Verrucomicrobium sp. GAS474 TaxID=1882831 RepID=UPI00087AD49A|nr:hypothetical protein [Verrucomicrobium sp. GAS474]SDT90612.1 hypothetical protein SAMN05444156_0616 [Verrucomicrobium sp. GAS474]
MKYLLRLLVLLVLPVLAHADSMITFAGGDGVSFTTTVPGLAIVYGIKNDDSSSWGFQVINAANGAGMGGAQFDIGSNITSGRPITAVVYLSQAGTYYIQGHSSQGGDSYNGVFIPDDATASQAALDQINAAISSLQDQTAQNTSAIASLSTLNTTLQDRIATLETNLNALQNTVQTGSSDLQSQIDALTSQLTVLKQVSATTTQTLQSQINSLSDRVTTVSSTSVKKSTLNTYLLYGATGLGAGALGVGLYTLFDSPSSPTTSTPKPSYTHAK